MNNALDMASGDIIGWINSDDTFCDNIFKNIINLFKNDKDLDIVIGDMNVVNIEMGKFKYRRRHLKYNFAGESRILGFYTTSSNGSFFTSEPAGKELILKKN